MLLPREGDRAGHHTCGRRQISGRWEKRWKRRIERTQTETEKGKVVVMVSALFRLPQKDGKATVTGSTDWTYA